MSSIVPKVYGVSSLQRKSRSILDEVKSSEDPVFLTEKNKVSYVLITADAYEAMNNESYFWTQAQASSLSFWAHESNDAYDEL